MSGGGDDSPTVAVAPERSASIVDRPATAAPSAPVSVASPAPAPPSEAEVPADSGVIDFDPVPVGNRPKTPRPSVARVERDPGRTAGPSVQASGTSNTAATHGVLSVIAEPAALVYLGDTFISESPVRGRLVKPGRYEVKLVRTVMPRPYRRTVNITVRAGQRVEVRHDEPPPRRR
jgi:hypothetical protein